MLVNFIILLILYCFNKIRSLLALLISYTGIFYGEVIDFELVILFGVNSEDKQAIVMIY